MDFEVDCPPPADSSSGDFLITMVKETVMVSCERSIAGRKAHRLRSGISEVCHELAAR